MRCLAVLVMLGCGSSVAPTPLAKPQMPAAPTVRLVGIEGASAKFVRISNAGVVVERTVAFPKDAVVNGVVWRGRDPIARVNGIVGTIDVDGFHVLPLPAFSPAPMPANDPDASESQSEDLIVDSHGVVWLYRCDHWGGPDGGGCEDARYMNVAAPATITTTSPVQLDPRPLPEVAAPPASVITAGLVDEPPDPDADPQVKRAPRKLLRCTSHGTTLEYPPVDQRTDQFYDMSDFRWISIDPPIFHVVKVEAGFTSVETPMTAEGCTEPGYDNTQFVVGPEEVVAFGYGDRTTIRWHGRELGSFPLARPDGPPPQNPREVMPPMLAFEEPAAP